MKEDKLFYVGQKAFIERDGKVLVLRDPVDGLDFPGGKIQEGESNFVESLKREVREETGLEIVVGDPFTTWYNKFPPHHRNANKEVYLVGFCCKYVSGEVRLSSEHDQFKWITRTTIQEVSEKSAYFEALEKYFQSQ